MHSHCLSVHFPEKGPNAYFFKISIFLILYTLLLTHLELEYLSWSCKASEFLISHTFQRKCYISIARTGKFIIYVLGLFSLKQR